MKKKIIILSILFTLSLSVGLYCNLQKGFHFDDHFWRFDDVDKYSSHSDWISYSPDDVFHLFFAGKDLKAVFIQLDKEHWRLDFSDGIAIETTDGSAMTFDLGRMEYIVTDIESGLFQFEPAEPSHS